MHIYSVSDPEFRSYGKLLDGYDTAELLSAMEKIDMPKEGTAYLPGIESLEDCAIFSELRDRAYGGMPIQLGMCWGWNTKLNCLEYHRDSEVNIGTAFRVPAGAAVEVWATTLHYAPCQTNMRSGFRVAVALPKGTNTEKPEFEPKCEEDLWMTARNKWLLAHPSSREAGNGAHVGLKGENIDIEEDI